MDYRHRNYYLVTIDRTSYDMRLRYYKIAAPSLEIHSPYNHFKYNKYKDGYDGMYTATSDYWQMMVSCKKEEAEALEYELNKAERRDGYISRYSGKYIPNSYYLKLDRMLCGQ